VQLHPAESGQVSMYQLFANLFKNSIFNNRSCISNNLKDFYSDLLYKLPQYPKNIQQKFQEKIALRFRIDPPVADGMKKHPSQPFLSKIS